jgi:hypothetical protein
MKLRSFAFGVALFLMAILCSQAIIYWACGGDRSSLPEGLEEAMRHRTPILLFGDSVLSHTGEHHEESTTIPRLLQARIAGIPLGVVTHRAFHAGVFLACGNYIVHQSFQPRLCIFEINMRSFSPGWDLRPEWQFEEERLLLSHGILFRIVFRALAVFKAFNLSPVKQNEFDHAPVFDGERVIGHVGDYPGPSARPTVGDLWVFDYMYALNKDHRKVRELVSLGVMLRRHGIEPLFYFTPVDYQTGDRSLGPRFEKRLAENIALLEQELADAGCPTLDLSRLLGPEAFDWRESRFPNEHLLLKGRTAVAERLSEAVQSKLRRSR